MVKTNIETNSSIDFSDSDTLENKSDDNIAKVVEFSTDPISSSINTAYKFAYYSSVGINVINTRYVLSETIDTVLYDSFDSYNATKNVYFQRFGSISSDSDDESLFTMYSNN